MPYNKRRLITMSDIAKQAFVSIGTVSRVLNNHPNVNADLRERVLKVMHELGYTGSESLSHTKSDYQATKHLAFYCARNEGSANSLTSALYFSMIAQGAEEECCRQQWHLDQCSFKDEPSELPWMKRMLLDTQTDACILIGFLNYELVNGIRELGLPLVLIDHHFPELALDVIMNDSYSGAFQATQHLIKRGHRQIVLINCSTHNPTRWHLEAYQVAHHQAGLSFNPAFILDVDSSFEGGQRAAETILHQQLKCSAILCASDHIAIGVMQTLTYHGLAIPDDISIMGFDNIEASNLVIPRLSTIGAYSSQIGQMAVFKALQRIADPTLPYTQTLIPAQLVLRESVRNLHAENIS